jgi:dihydroxy-acid dehydratase
MGTASTMACVTAALGLMPLRGASAPAVSSARLRIAEETGALAVKLTQAEPRQTLQTMLTKESFLNAITVLQAIGGSTNAVVHLMAIVNRHPLLQGEITLSTFDEIGSKTPLLVDLKPSGDNYMIDFHNAGGMLALLHTLRPILHLSARTITGQTLGEVLDCSPFRRFESAIIRPLSSPLYPRSSLVVLRGNLAPDGAIMKASASKDRALLRHRGQAITFENAADLAARLDSPDLPVTRDSVLVLKGIGPIGNPGMPEAGLIPIPRKLASQGVTDMLRISDGRMSGTAGGTIVLHVSPEAAVPESPLGAVKDGDWIRIDTEIRELVLEVDDDEMNRRVQERREAIQNTHGDDAPPWVTRNVRRGYRGLYERSVNQAHEGADFDFLTANGPQ